MIPQDADGGEVRVMLKGSGELIAIALAEVMLEDANVRRIVKEAIGHYVNNDKNFSKLMDDFFADMAFKRPQKGVN